MVCLVIPNITQTEPTDIVPEISDYYFYHGQVNTIFYVKAESEGLYAATPLINVSIATNRLDVQGIELEFLGASKYFPIVSQYHPFR